MTIVIGLDIGKHGRAVCCALEDFPDNLTAYYYGQNARFFKIAPDKLGVETLLKIKPEALIMEPTGGWYSRFWEHFARVYGIPLYWVGHADLYAERKHHNFQNKRDDIDALILAATYFDDRFVDRFGEKRYLSTYHLNEVAQVRELFYEAEQLDKIRTALVLQLRQRLSFEFPEYAGKDYNRSGKTGLTPFFKWLQNPIDKGAIGKAYADSVAHLLGIDLSKYTEDHAKLLTIVEKRLFETETLLHKTLQHPTFKRYLEAFAPYGFGTTINAMLLNQCFPFERFLFNDKPLIDYYQSKKGKILKRHVSLRSFQAYFGLNRVYIQSGDEEKRKFGGSKIIRAHLFIWARGKLCRGHTEKSAHFLWKGDKADHFVPKFVDHKAGGVKGKDAIFRCLYKVTRHLFYDLAKTFKE